jgi:hypothetical protein
MVGLILPALVAAVVAGLKTGSLAGLQRIRVLWWQLAIGSIAVLLIIHNAPFNRQSWALEWGQEIWVVCLAAMLAVLVRNALQAGPARLAWAAGALGVALNMTVVVINGGYMPQSQEARLAARGAMLPPDANVAQLYNVKALGDDTHFNLFGDIIAQPTWLPKSNVVSAGDMILSLAMGGLVFITITRRDPHLQEPSADS